MLWLFTQLPYGLIREERIRAYGEVKTTVWVLEQLPKQTSETNPYRLRFRYHGPDGILRESAVAVHRDIWESAFPGSGIQGFVSCANPSLCRLSGQEEEPFRLWLRNALGGAAK